MTNATLACRRCKGSGLVSSGVMHAGTPGGCFKCGGRGWVYADKFVEAFHAEPGTVFVGVSFTYAGVTTKQIRKVASVAALAADCERGVTLTEITDEQARKFFARHGFRVELAAA